MTDGRKLVSIICPVFNEAPSIELFYDRLVGVLGPLRERYDFEIIFSNNRSTDETRERVLELRERDPAVQLITLSRNFGYQYSVFLGLRQASGDAMLVIDVDCEDPPELIPRFLGGWEEGHDIVYGERGKREEPAPVTWMRKLFYRLNKSVADSDIILDMAEFALITRAVRDAVVSTRSTFPFVRAEIAHWGFERKAIPYDRERRLAGQTHYNLWGMTRFAIAGILSSTTAPLRALLYMLPFTALANIALLALEVTGTWSWGFKTLVTLDLLYLHGATAVLALYLSRTYRNVEARPIALIDWRQSAADPSPAASRSDA